MIVNNAEINHSTLHSYTSDLRSSSMIVAETEEDDPTVTVGLVEAASNSGIMITGRQLMESGLMSNGIWSNVQQIRRFWQKSITAGLMIAAKYFSGLLLQN